MVKKTFIFSFVFLPVFLLNSCKEDKPTPPVLTTTSATEVSYTTATSGGNITNEGGSSALSMGVCWSTSPNPTTDNSKTTEKGSSSSFTSNITDLTPNTLYYIRAYATNNVGTGYGNLVSFTTNKLEFPDLTTTSVTEITEVSASSGGNVTEENGSSVIAKGVCWSTLDNPSITDKKTSDGSGLGAFSSNITGLKAGTTYHVRSYATNSTGTSYGEDRTFTTLTVPTVTTSDVSDFTLTSVFCGGNITSDGGLPVTARGLCWNTTQNPTITDNITNNGTGIGSFTSNLPGLEPNLIYHIRAYATNSLGTSYGNELTFKAYALVDVDNNFYHSVTFGTQTWMQENLKTKKYRNGDIIGTTTKYIPPESTPNYQWPSNGNESNVASYGRLYSWYAVIDDRGLCPTGWHVPTDEEWTTLTDYLINNGYGIDGSGNDIAKSMASETGWTYPPAEGDITNDNNNNSSGFSAVPAGSVLEGNLFLGFGYICHWWSSTEYGKDSAMEREIYFTNPDLQRFFVYYKGGFGASVRCIKN